jgi:hypothetical protein
MDSKPIPPYTYRLMVYSPQEAVLAVLAYVREKLAAGTLDEAGEALQAARTYLEIHRPPQYRMYNPKTWLGRRLSKLLDPETEVAFEPVSECPGDPEHVLACLGVLLENVRLEADARLVVELFEEDEQPRLAMRCDGPGAWPDLLRVRGFAPLRFEVLRERWTVATRGGRLDHTPQGLELKLKGVRIVPESDDALVPIFLDVVAASEHLRGALADLVAASKSVESAIQQIMAEGQPAEAADFSALIREVREAMGEGLAEQSIHLEGSEAGQLPPLVIRRGLMKRALAGTIAAVTHGISRGGSAAVSCNYAPRERAVECTISAAGALDDSGQEPYLTALPRHVVETVHAGGFTFIQDASGAEALLSVPDVAGRALDGWIPGWDSFTSRTQQVLRLLKSGGAVPPQEMLLEAALEEELEHWLLPRLSSPAARNVAHDLSDSSPAHAKGSKDRRAKALGQLRRGKPRKEITKPVYAAEILWAFRETERGRNALVANKLGKEDLEALSDALLGAPPDSVTALIAIAHVLSV